ncbi:uncharacterized protein LOC108145012 [Drosophila elegans]|uniref:uncharacterized protein LOC108145012 n=1 Tax=Drosophila elegans TaxID=30023 RepID=UPI0007E63B5C|nr:uncharacterized protein LOC108145012 [Drosophila elegans]
MSLLKLSFEVHKMKLSENPSEELALGPNTQWEESGVKKQPMKQKNLLRKPRLHCLYGKARAEGLDWVQNNISNGEEQESNWVKTASKNKVNGKAYEMKALISECENLKRCVDSDSGKTIESAYDCKDLMGECGKLEDDLLYEGTGDLYRNPDEENVNELACYLEDMVNIPKKRSAMVEMIYS